MSVQVAVKFICLTRSLNFIEIFYAAIRRAVRILTDPKHSTQSITQQSVTHIECEEAEEIVGEEVRGIGKKHIQTVVPYCLAFNINLPKGPVWMPYNMLRLAGTKSMNKYALIWGLTTHTHSQMIVFKWMNEWMNECAVPLFGFNLFFRFPRPPPFCYRMCVCLFICGSIFSAMGLLFILMYLGLHIQIETTKYALYTSCKPSLTHPHPHTHT